MNIHKEQLFVPQSSVNWETTNPGVRRKVMAYGNKGMATYVEFESGAVGPLHHHSHLQISFVHSGSFEVQINGQKQIVQTGDYFYIPSNAEHGVTALEKSVLVDFFHPMREDFIKM